MDGTKVTVMKFGGSCFQNSEAFSKIKTITEHFHDERKIYVASALKGITDKLMRVTKSADSHDAQGVFTAIKEIEKQHTNTIHEIFNGKPEIIKEAESFISNKLAELQTVLLEIEEFGLEPYFQDYVLSFGEKLSTYLLALYLRVVGFNAEYYTGEDLIITNDDFTNALPDFKYTFQRVRDRIAPLLDSERDDTIFCVTGFIGRNKIGYTTTLGRGGSDFTATILARSVYESCKNPEVKVILWKDVDGILTSNPKFVDNPTLVKNLNYKEAAESAFFGAKILHPKCLAAIEQQHIRVEIRNFDKHDETEEFSVISGETHEGQIKGISSIEKVAMINISSGTLVNVPGVLGKIFSIMGENGISVSLVAQSSTEVNTTFIVEHDQGERAITILRKSEYFSDWFSIEMEEGAIIAVIGDQISKSNRKIFSALESIDVQAKAIAQSSDGLNISLVVGVDEIKDAVYAINKEFQLKK